jgi:hypothetical protein
LKRSDGTQSLDRRAGQRLGGASLEWSPIKKAMVVRPYETSLTDVIEKHVPHAYKVFADANVSVDSLLQYDECDHWAAALGKSCVESGLDITAT